MKKPLLIVLIIVAVILALPVALCLKWVFQEKKPLDVIIVDKTVPAITRENHRSLMWVLTNERFVKKENKSSYSFRKDYYGFYPLKPLREKQFKRKDYRLAELIELSEAYDALYYTDLYGVFFNDWYHGLNKNRRSRKLYGGMNNNDYLLMVEMKNRDKLVILEYNTFDYPTASLERYQAALRDQGYQAITTEVRPAPAFYYAEAYHQQYLAKNPGGYCGLGGTGVSCPSSPARP